MCDILTTFAHVSWSLLVWSRWIYFHSHTFVTVWCFLLMVLSISRYFQLFDYLFHPCCSHFSPIIFSFLHFDWFCLLIVLSCFLVVRNHLRILANWDWVMLWLTYWQVAFGSDFVWDLGAVISLWLLFNCGEWSIVQWFYCLLLFHQSPWLIFERLMTPVLVQYFFEGCGTPEHL